MSEHKLLIIPVFKSLFWMRKFRYKKTIQNSPTKFGIKIKNIGDKPICNFLIKEISTREGNNLQGLKVTSKKEFKVENLNPDEEKIIWFEVFVFPFSNSAWCELRVIGQEGEEIETYQWDKGNKIPAEHDKNKWGDTFFIKDEGILQQQITNYLLIILMILTLVNPIKLLKYFLLIF